MFGNTLHSISRCAGSAAVLLLLLGAVGGCQFWDAQHWNPERYRDDRAVDIEERLERAEPVVQNPF